MDHVQLDNVLQYCQRLLLTGAFTEHPFYVVVGDPGVTFEYLNTPAFHASLVRYLAEASAYLHVFGLVVVRTVKNRARFLLDELLETSGHGRRLPGSDAYTVHMPMAVEPLDPATGSLHYVDPGHGKPSHWMCAAP